MNTNDPVDENSVFEIGSISKSFTRIILADQVIKAKMNLDDPIQKYLPDNVTAPMRNGEPIGLVHLANHTSGLPRLPSNFSPAYPYADFSEKQLYDFLDDYELTRDIGVKYEYSNYAMVVLGNVLAQTNDMTYEELTSQESWKQLTRKVIAI